MNYGTENERVLLVLFFYDQYPAVFTMRAEPEYGMRQQTGNQSSGHRLYLNEKGEEEVE